MVQSTEEFESVQKCKQPFIWLVITGLSVFVWYSTYQHFILGNPIGDNPAPDSVMIIIWLIIGIGFPLTLLSMKLVIKIDSDTFYYRLFPLHISTHSYPHTDIESIEVVSYRPILDFGGWGIRWGRKGKGYIVDGKEGVKITLKTGKKVYFSSNEPKEIVHAFDTFSTVK